MGSRSTRKRQVDRSGNIKLTLFRIFQINVFRVKSESGKSIKTLHMKKLLQFNCIPSCIEMHTAPVVKRKSRSPDTGRSCAKDTLDTCRSEDSSESDSGSLKINTSQSEYLGHLETHISHYHLLQPEIRITTSFLYFRTPVFINLLVP